MTQPTDEELAADIAELVKRMPRAWFGDAVALLKLAEERGIPGCLEQAWHHSKGRVHRVDHGLKMHRQQEGRKTA